MPIPESIASQLTSPTPEVTLPHIESTEFDVSLPLTASGPPVPVISIHAMGKLVTGVIVLPLNTSGLTGATPEQLSDIRQALRSNSDLTAFYTEVLSMFTPFVPDDYTKPLDTPSAE